MSSSLSVSGATLFNSNVSMSSSLSVSGSWLLNYVSINSLLYVSGPTILNNLTSINSSLHVSGVNVLNSLNTHNTSLSTLINFRSDNPQAIVTQNTAFSTSVHGVYSGSEIIFDTFTSMSNYLIAGNTCLTKIDTIGQLNVYRAVDSFLPTRGAGYWVVHDELSGVQKDLLFQKSANALKFAALDVTIDGVSLVGTGAAAGVAEIMAGLGISSLITGFLGGGWRYRY